MANFIFDTGKVETLVGKTIVVTRKLKTFTSRDELKECLAAAGAELTETLSAGVDFFLTNTPNSGTAKNKKAEELGIQKITEKEFNDLIGGRKHNCTDMTAVLPDYKTELSGFGFHGRCLSGFVKKSTAVP